jgi:hypothetical protein
MTTIRTSAVKQEPYIPSTKPKEETVEAKDKTVGGKDIEVMRDPVWGMYIINFPNGGEKPTLLQGHFTSIAEAKKAIDTYNIRKSKVKPSASTKSE